MGTLEFKSRRSRFIYLLGFHTPGIDKLYPKRINCILLQNKLVFYTEKVNHSMNRVWKYELFCCCFFSTFFLSDKIWKLLLLHVRRHTVENVTYTASYHFAFKFSKYVALMGSWMETKRLWLIELIDGWIEWLTEWLIKSLNS